MKTFYATEEILTPPSRVKVNNSLSFSMSLREAKRVEEAFGIKVKEDSPSGWAKLTWNVEEHTDGYGKCLVYIAEGAGRLHIGGVPHNLMEGNFITFDDKVPHAFDVVGRSVTILVCSYFGKVKNELLDSFNHIPRKHK